MKTIGVDIGGSHITVAEVTAGNLQLVPGTFYRETVDSKGDTKSIMNVWTRVLRVAAGNHEDFKIGVAIPGPFDYRRGISYIKDQRKYDALYGLNIKEVWSKILGVPQENIRFNNDAACFLQGEVYKIGRRSCRVIGVTLGTGLGSAFISDGKAVDADLWNTQFNDGIIEDYISSRWFVSEFKTRTGREVKDVKELVGKYASDPVVDALFSGFTDHLSDFLKYFVLLKNAECIVIGGNIAKASPFFLDKLELKLKQRLGFEIPIYISLLNENAALIGGASQFF